MENCAVPRVVNPSVLMSMTTVELQAFGSLEAISVGSMGKGVNSTITVAEHEAVFPQTSEAK